MPLLNGVKTDDYLSIMSDLMGIEVPEDSRQQVINHLENAARMADIVNAVALDENTIELANVFTPGEPL